MTKRVLYDRSVVMARAFVAVGALHPQGSRGLLALLEEDGYRATRVF